MKEIKGYEIDKQPEGNIEKMIITDHYYSPNSWEGKTFVNCIFRGIFQINPSQKKINLIFNNCILESTVRTIKDGVKGAITFSACKIKTLSFTGDFDTVYIDSFNGKQTYISSLILRECCFDSFTVEDSIVSTFIAHKCKFRFLSTKDIKIRDHLNSNHCFYEYWDFLSSPGIKSLKIDAPVEKSKISFSNLESVEHLKLMGDFSNSMFNIIDSSIDKLELNYFKNLKSDIEFENVSVNDSCIVNYSNLKNARFYDCEFEKSKLYFWYSYIYEIVTIRNSWFQKILASDPLGKCDSSLNQHQVIEYFRQMKLNSISQKKYKESLEFYSNEMEMYYASNKCWTKPEAIIFESNSPMWKVKIDKFITWLVSPFYDFIDVFFVVPLSSKRKNWADGVLMYFNKYSNRFGRYWVRPALLYLVISYLLFAWIGNYKIIFTKFRLDVLKDPLFARFLNPIHKISISEILQHQNSFYSFLELFTLIVQGYLIYQIIRSFRKFSFKIF
ncbi:MAG: hypothetical protein HQ522_02990 [Bacteroidetes bacterium]|nr:hypothetical protein [Bacteroidota bacterium]